jgi:hypothetical protein
MSQDPLCSAGRISIYWRRVLFLRLDCSSCLICCIHVQSSYPFEKLYMSEKYVTRMLALYRVIKVHCVSPACRFGFGLTQDHFQSPMLESEFISERPTEQISAQPNIASPLQ